MNRTLVVVLVGLVVGAAGMQFLTNFRIRVEPATDPYPAPKALVQHDLDPPDAVEAPRLLPERVTRTMRSPAPVRNANGVVQAAAVNEPMASAAEAAIPPVVAPQAEPLTVLRVEDGPFQWNPIGTILLKSTTLKIVMSRPLEPTETIQWKVGNTPPLGKDDVTKAIVADGPKLPGFTINTNLLPDGSKDGTVSAKVLVNGKDTVKPVVATVTIRRPAELNGLTNFVDVTAYLTSPFVRPETSFVNPIEVYGTYLRLSGRRYGEATNGTVRFITAIGNLNPVAVNAESKSADSTTGTWDSKLVLDQFGGFAPIDVYAVVEFNGKHFYFPTAVKIKFNSLPSSLAAPSGVTLAPPTTNPDNKVVALADDPLGRGYALYRGNTRKVKVVVPNDVSSAQGIVVFADAERPGVVFKPIPGAELATRGVEIEVGPGRDHVVRVAAFKGDMVGTPAQFDLQVRTEGPVVENVAAPGFGDGTSPISIRFNQDNPLKKEIAQTLANYGIKHEEGAREPELSTAKFDATTNTVTLSVTGVVPGSFRLSLKKSGVNSATQIEDVFGNKLSAVSGLKDSTNNVFETVLYSQKNESLPSVSTGVTLQTAPHTVFPEYTKFRVLEDGFNPSDRVETRVVRLYYNRDANRVAQIVNRDVKAHNQVSVDVRRRVADRTRDDANAATDERQRLEREAVQKATESRAAEAEMKRLQNKAGTSRGESTEARIQLTQKQNELIQARQDLERAKIAAETRAATDPTNDTQIARVETLQAQVTQLTTDIDELKAFIRSAATQAEDKRKATDLLQSKELELASARATLSRALAGVPNKVATNTAVQAQETAVDTAETKVAKARRDALNPVSDADKLVKNEAVAFEERAMAVELRKLQRLRLATEESADAAIDPNRAVVTQLELDIRKQQRIISSSDSNLTEKRQADVQLRQLNAELSQAKREQDRAIAAARGRASADSTSLDPAQRRVNQLESEIRTLQQVASNGDAAETAARNDLALATGKLQAAREGEVRANETAQIKAANELRLREDQFRREVAAAKEDPDVHAPGKPTSLDPVQQCSISVIGEGLIQIRGPIKGLNIIRTMINQLDSPTGQVRIAVHTVQVNGERADRMEKVVANIQRYLDHSRFLTDQSAQMLRKAVTSVAARKAEEAVGMSGIGCTQAERDQKYLHAFFGKDFVDELKTLDSEFLRTGNKILSLHSMDSTSLSSALFMMALAKNNVRTEILAEFQNALRCNLPQAELNFYQAGLSGGRCEACFDRKFYMLAYNAKFQSFIGYFNSEVSGDDTMTPIQREFVRLAQIFKTRMITELQLKQRVMERSLLEERIGRNYLLELQKAADLEEAAKIELGKLRDTLRQVAAESQTGIFQLLDIIDRIDDETQDVADISSELAKLFDQNTNRKVLNPDGTTTQQPTSRQKSIKTARGENYAIPEDATVREGDQLLGINLKKVPGMMPKLVRIRETLGQFYFISKENYDEYKQVQDFVQKADNNEYISKTEFIKFNDNLTSISRLIRAESANAKGRLRAILLLLTGERADPVTAFVKYQGFRDDILSKINNTSTLKQQAQKIFDDADPTFKRLVQTGAGYQAAKAKADASRRPLDEKKLLDLLVDEVEDKHIELLEGTRAHTANVDNYLKNLATALETDFNTQFNQPAFRRVRESGQSWDVTLGQIETTTVLTNNRMFAKVSPAATMEFDLPKRDIFITEGFKSAKALFDEYGALVNDPTFLAAARLYSGVPLNSPGVGLGNLSPVRNVLPGLPSSPDEMLLAQGGPGRKEFGAAFESLIPDPAIYKIETGTGYEIRPVLSPDGQNVVFNFNYMYTTDVREPVRADEKHLGRVKRHFVNTDVQLSNFELREVSKYQVALKVARTGKGVQLLQDIPGVGVLFRPLPSAGTSLQQNLIYAQSTIFPTLFDLMGLRYAPAVADVDPSADINDEWVVRNRRRDVEQRIFDVGATRVDEALRIPYGERRPDLYRTQETIPYTHPSGYYGPGLRLRDSNLREGYPEAYDPRRAYPETPFAPRTPVNRSEDPLFDPFQNATPGNERWNYPQMAPREIPNGTISTTVTPRGSVPPMVRNGTVPTIPAIPVPAHSGLASQSPPKSIPPFQPTPPAPIQSQLVPSNPIPAQPPAPIGTYQPIGVSR